MSTSLPGRTARRRNKIGGTVLVVALVGALIAIVTIRSLGEKVVNNGGTTVVLVDKAFAGGMDAAGTGVLADIDGCLGWAGPDGTATDGTIVVWPHGTTVVSDDPLRVRIDGDDYELGDTIDIGGGEGGRLDETSYFYDKVPTGCLSHNTFIANNG